MENQNRTVRPHLAISIVVSAFIILPLVIAIIISVMQIASHVSVEEALQSDVDTGIIQTIAEQKNIDLSTSVVHEVTSDGDWLAAIVVSTSPSELGNSILAVLHKQDGAYQVVYFGTGYSEATLTELGAPSGLAKNLINNGKTTQYGSVLYNSYLNPTEKYPLLEKLPFLSDNLKITYNYNSDLKDSDGIGIPTIQIAATNAANRSLGLSKIRSFGYDPGDYRITFTDLKNPFISEPVEQETTLEIINEENQGP